MLFAEVVFSMDRRLDIFQLRAVMLGRSDS
jgi:hypothetical protein